MVKVWHDFVHIGWGRMKKRILIFGAHSYIGEAVEAWLKKKPEQYHVTTISSRDYKDAEGNFSDYDVVFYVAGIAHRKETKENAHLYYEVNRNLAIAVAKRAKKDGVGHFILMSSLSVYGLEQGVITAKTKPHPVSHYGKSKYQADKAIAKLSADTFRVAILRPPMVYGNGCKGNYGTLRKLALKLPCFPEVKNQRSMVYVENLAGIIEEIIRCEKSGLFFPQNEDYVCTSDMVELIALANGKKLTFMKAAGVAVQNLPVSYARKAFGSLICKGDKGGSVAITGFKETIDRTEGKRDSGTMKKVLFVATVVQLHINVFHIPYLKWFHEQGWQVDVAAANDYENPADCVIPYCDHFYELPFERSPFNLKNLDAYKKLKALIDQGDYDIIHCHTPVGGVAARLAADHARKSGKTKVIYTAHGFHFYKGAPMKNWLLFYPVEKIMAHKTDLLITMNREDYQAAKKFRAKRIACVHGVGVNLNQFTPIIDEEKTEVRKQLGLKDDDIFAITVGNLIRRKNQITLIRTTAALHQPNFHLFICGNEDDKSNYQATLEAEAEKLNVSSQVHFLGFREDVNKLYGAADMFLFASYQEGLPKSVMEAMACGVPIIVSKVRGNVDLIDNGKGGFLVAVTDVDGYVKATQKILKADKRRLQKMTQYNLNKVQQYKLESVVEEMAVLYRSMM